MELLFSKFTAAALRHGLPRRFVQLGRVSVTTMGVLGSLVASLVGLLAESAETKPADDELNSSIRGGDLNFRTGKFDDGTDPAGWYGRD